MADVLPVPAVKRGPGRPELHEDKLELAWCRVPKHTLRTLEQTAANTGTKLSPVIRYLLDAAIKDGRHLEFIRQHHDVIRAQAMNALASIGQ